jgi:hypothetical protein
MDNSNITNIQLKKIIYNEPIDNSFEPNKSILPDWLTSDSNPLSYPLTREDFSSLSLPSSNSENGKSKEVKKQSFLLTGN